LGAKTVCAVPDAVLALSSIKERPLRQTGVFVTAGVLTTGNPSRLFILLPLLLRTNFIYMTAVVPVVKGEVIQSMAAVFPYSLGLFICSPFLFDLELTPVSVNCRGKEFTAVYFSNENNLAQLVHDTGIDNQHATIQLF